MESLILGSEALHLGVHYIISVSCIPIDNQYKAPYWCGDMYATWFPTYPRWIDLGLS